MAPVTTIIRRRGKAEKRRFDTLAAAVDDLETELRAAATEARRAPRPERALGREYAPADRVVVRGELRGPGRLRAGVDVRGDGSAQAYTGIIRRQVLEPAKREDAWSALRRALGLDGGR